MQLGVQQERVQAFPCRGDYDLRKLMAAEAGPTEQDMRNSSDGQLYTPRGYRDCRELQETFA